MNENHFADGYDSLASGYSENWQVYLKPLTDRLISGMPANSSGRILDLGCGNGYALSQIEKLNPGAEEIIGVDISEGMLKIASEKHLRSKLVRQDMLEFIRAEKTESADMIFSSWAFGYSKYEIIIREAARVLKNGGTFAFIVNLIDTMPAVFYAYRKTIIQFPDRVNMAIFPSFPKDSKQIEEALQKYGFRAVSPPEDGVVKITPPSGTPCLLDWLLKTGVLAGFSSVIDLHHDQEIRDYFEYELKSSGLPLQHHYYMGIFVKELPDKRGGN